jgi:hypothetical protein
MKKQAKLSDVRHALETAVDAITQIELRAEDSRPELSFEQRIIEACRAMDNGDPLKDYLDRDDIEQAIETLGDIYTVTGVRIPPDWN